MSDGATGLSAAGRYFNSGSGSGDPFVVKI